MVNMNMYDRIAKHNNHESWDDFIEKAKTENLEFSIPTYLLSSKSQNFLYNELFAKIKQMNFKLVIENDKIILTRDIDTDIIATSNEEEENEKE